jgi:Pyridoxamine 5'-phosphate oxidase
MSTAEEGGGRRCRQPVVAGSTPEERDPQTWPPGALASLQRILDASRSTSGAAVRDTFDRADRHLTAAEFVAFWNGTRMKAMATAGENGPHIAPVHAEFAGGRLRSTIYENAARRRDLRRNPAVALTTWGPNGAAAIVYGRAREVPGSRRETRPGATGRPRRTVTLEIEVTRIYAMGPREAGARDEGRGTRDGREG